MECYLPADVECYHSRFSTQFGVTLNIIWADTYCLLQKSSACLFLYNAKLITIIRHVARQPVSCSAASCNWQTHSRVHNFCSPWFSKTVRNCSKITRRIETGGGAQLQECLLKYKYAKIQKGAAVSGKAGAAEAQQQNNRTAEKQQANERAGATSEPKFKKLKFYTIK